MLTKKKFAWIVCFLCSFMLLMACGKEQEINKNITKQPELTATPVLTLEPTKEVIPTSTPELTKTPTLTPHSHSYDYQYLVVRNPDCTSDGEGRWYCSCGEFMPNTISAKGHSWQAATCTAAKKCTVCGTTEGAAKGHSWQAATCTAAKKCTVCGATEGVAKGHNWQAATCTEAKRCTVCGATEGSAAGHNITDDGTKRYCIKCGYVVVTASWGEWSAWSTTAVTATDNRQVETRVENVPVSVTEYRYSRTIWYREDSTLHSSKKPPYSEGYTEGTPKPGNKKFAWDYTEWMPESQRVTSVSAEYGIDVYKVNGTSYYTEESRTISDTISQTQYRYREKEVSETQSETTTGDITSVPTQSESEASWGEWSGWGTEKATASDNRQVETRTVTPPTRDEYRYQRVLWYREDSTLHSSKKPPYSEGYTEGTPKPGNKEFAWDYTEWMPENQRVTGVSAEYGIDVYKVNGTSYYTEESRTIANTESQIQYRYRDKLYPAD